MAAPASPSISAAVSPTAAPPTPGTRDLEGTAQYLFTELSGAGCFTASDSNVLVGLGPTDADVAAAGVSAGWLKEGEHWVGSLDLLLDELGGVEVGRSHGIIAWALMMGTEHPYAQEFMRSTTVENAEVWMLIDSIRACDDPRPAASALPVATHEATCKNAEVGYAIEYPADWFVLPPDFERGIPECALFAAEPFTFVPGISTGFGASVYISTWAGSCLEFGMVDPTPDVLGEVTIGGLPAYLIDFSPPGALEAHSYLVNLTPEAGEVLQYQGDGSCENSHALSIRTDGSGPGAYELNRRVADRIAASLITDVAGAP
ncbi:MAG TPA: hypothetical protein VEW95_02240 [Candidatus Limnocylindrales bacterium]|nr:hypothetical protein [Candidatus Limnocylindrales bacterium]